jgi:hypothetical protein
LFAESTALHAGLRVLPDPLSALGQIRRKPAFLTPDATKPIAAPIHRSRPVPTPAQPDPAAQRSSTSAGAAFDIASMAPPLKGQADPSKRALPAGAVIAAAAKRYKPADDDGGELITAAQIAMLGGQWKPTADDGTDASPAALGPAPPAHMQQQRMGLLKQRMGKPSKPMGVSDFLDKGVGGAQLPRRRQERKDKEKSKRQLGQSAIGSWKSEAEMVLRQQYDS